MVRAKANEISASDDALVKRLQREVQHLRYILNIRRKGQTDPTYEKLQALDTLHDQVQQLKQENYKLKESNLDSETVEKLKQENKVMRLEIQRLMANNTQQNFNTGSGIDMENGQNTLNMTDYEGNNEWQDDPENKLQDEEMAFEKRNDMSPSIDTDIVQNRPKDK